MDGKLPHLNLSTSSFDFNYQINRPRFISTSFDENFKVNRLSKWNAIKGIFELNKPGEGKVVEHKFYAARCELDISTDADFMDELPKEDLKAFLEYAIGFSQEILDNGDCE